MQTIAATARAAATSGTALALGLLDRLAALDAGYRSARRLAAAAPERLADMGISRDEAEAELDRFPSWPAGDRRPLGPRFKAVAARL